MKKPLTSKERVLTAFAHQQPDRVPVDYLSNPGIDLRLKQHYGLQLDDHERLLQTLGVDFRYLWAPYRGPKLHPDLPGRTIDEWGIHRRWVEHDSGGYWDYTDFPLKDVSLEMVETWPLPNPDHFDYTRIRPFCEQFQDYCVVAGSAGIGDIINSTGMLRTMQQVMFDLITDDRFSCVTWTESWRSCWKSPNASWKPARRYRYALHGRGPGHPARSAAQP
jgi:hypothetical protein